MQTILSQLKWIGISPVVVTICLYFILENKAFSPSIKTEVTPSETRTFDSKIVSQMDRQIALLEGQITKSPGSFPLRTRLARAYIQKARESGDPSYFNRAEKLFTKYETHESDNAETLGLLAWISLFKHDFRAAAELAEKALMINPHESWNYGVLSDANLEMGDYSKAVSYAQRMVDLRPDQGSYSRVAHLRSLYGDPEGAIELWHLSIRAGAPHAENTAWCQVELGEEYFGQGKLRDAEEAYQASLKTFPGYYRGLAGLARVRQAQQKWAEAAELYQRAAGVIPYPQYISALGDIYLEMGQPEEARKQYELVDHIARLDQVNQVQYNRDLALFYADHARNLQEALHLAEKELELRKDIHTYDVLAWVYYQNKRYPEANRAVKEALRLGTKDARTMFHAGMISLALGNREEAKTYLSRALATNPYLHPSYRRTAQQALEAI